MFEELSDIFSDHNNHLTSRELLMKVRMLGLLSALDFAQGKKRCLRALWLPAVPWESLKGLERRTLGFYAKSKKPGTEKIQSPAPWLHWDATRLWNLALLPVAPKQASLQTPSAGS